MPKQARATRTGWRTRGPSHSNAWRAGQASKEHEQIDLCTNSGGVEEETEAPAREGEGRTPRLHAPSLFKHRLEREGPWTRLRKFASQLTNFHYLGYETRVVPFSKDSQLHGRTQR